MRSERLYLADIMQACDAIEKFIAGFDEARFLTDDLHKAAVLQKLTVIGEAATRLSKGLRERHPHVNWRAAVGLRNFAVHVYFAVRWDIIWTTTKRDIPVLRKQIEEIYPKEFPGETPLFDESS